MRQIGSLQATLLRLLRERGGWHRGCGWVWDSPSKTEAILKALVERGKATVDNEGKSPFYCAVDYATVPQNQSALAGDHAMAKNLSTPKNMDRAASDSAPGGMKKLDPAPGGGMIRSISGPSIHAKNPGGNLKNNTGVDEKATVQSP